MMIASEMPFGRIKKFVTGGGETEHNIHSTEYERRKGSAKPGVYLTVIEKKVPVDCDCLTIQAASASWGRCAKNGNC